MHDTLCATGHRPDKLGGYCEATDNRLRAIARLALEREDPTTMMVGMALGWDTAVALACTDLHIPFIAAVPFKGQDNAWPYNARRRYNDILAKAEHIVIVCQGGYAPWKMHRRNEFMAEETEGVIALWNGDERGGTCHCVNYARSLGRPIYNYWKEFLNG